MCVSVEVCRRLACSSRSEHLLIYKISHSAVRCAHLYEDAQLDEQSSER